MRILSIFLILLMVAGMAGAQWYPKSADLNTTGDVNADNGNFIGDLSVTGIGSFTGGTVNSGVYDGNFRLAANHFIYSTTGTGGIDWSNATGIFKPPTGINTFGGISDFNAAMTARGITQDSGYSLIQSGAAGITVGTAGITASVSPIKLLENLTIAANKSLTGLSGSGAVDFSAMAGGYSSPLGTNTFNGNILGAGLTTTTTGGGAVTLKGNTTVYTDKSLAVTTIDKLTVGGVIVPQYWDFNVPISASSVDTNVFVPTSSWQVVAVSEVHNVAGNDAAAVNVTLTKCTGTQTPTQGTPLLQAVINLKGTANTIISSTPVTGSGLCKVNSTERLALDFTGTLTTLAGGVVTVRLKRV
jgi:hypothetical protein